MLSEKFFTTVVHRAFLLLFFLTPLLLSTRSYELFEFPKMLFIYGITIVVVASWLGSVLVSGKVIWKKSWLDPVLLLILVTQFISTLVSLHPHTSWYGYYSRFHGGMLSTICYALLAWAFVRFARKKWIEDMFLAAIASASLVSLYGVAEHFGIDAHMWVQDVQNRIFSTLGQPNWLSAWLGALLPVVMWWFFKPPKSIWPAAICLNLATVSISYGITILLTKNTLPVSGIGLTVFIATLVVVNGLLYSKAKQIKPLLEHSERLSFLVLFLLFATAVLFTKSRSGILAFGVSTVVFFTHFILSSSKNTLKTQKNRILAFLGSLLLLFGVIGTEWTPTFSQILGNSSRPLKDPFAQSQKPTNVAHPEYVSDSTDIRKVVWEGAYNVIQKYPVFGSGTETFAYAYYQVRPQEHNDTSEWDFLYNKAHNEYLNYLANNGIAGTSAILLLIVAAVWVAIKTQWKRWLAVLGTLAGVSVTFSLVSPSLFQKIVTKLFIYPPLLVPLCISLAIAILLWLFIQWKVKPTASAQKLFDSAALAMITSIVITNFYGFSVVTVALLFFLLPAFMIVKKEQSRLWEKQLFAPMKGNDITLVHVGAASALIFTTLFLLLSVYLYYKADDHYASSRSYLNQGKVIDANKQIDEAIHLRACEADYYLQKALIASQTAYAVSNYDSEDSADLVKTLVGQATEYTKLALETNPVHLNIYKTAVRIYITLALLDPQYYTLATKTLQAASKLSPTDPQLPLNLGILAQQIGDLTQAETYFKQATTLKPNYRKAWLTLGELYTKQEKSEEAREVYKFVMENIDPEDVTSQQQLKLLENSN